MGGLGRMGQMRNVFALKSVPIRTHSCPFVVRFLLLLTGFWLASSRSLAAETPFEQACAKLASRIGKDAERLHALFQLDWEHAMRENPEFATEVGYPGQNDRWTDSSLEAIERRKRELKA